MKDSGHKVKRMGQAFMYLLMEMFTKVNLRMEIGKDKVVILGLIKVIIKGSGLQIR